jgi:hypothetical protein
MKRILLFTILFVAGFVKAQNYTIEWMDTIPGGSAGVLADSLGNSYIFRSPNFIEKRSTSGSLVSTFTLNGSGSCYKLLFDNAGNISVLLKNTDMYLTKYTPSGGFIWDLYLNDPGTPANMVFDAENSAVIVANNYTSILTCKVNSNGSLGWKKTFSSGTKPITQVFSVTADSLENYFVSATSTTSNNPFQHIDSLIVLKYSTNGTLIKSVQYQAQTANPGDGITVNGGSIYYLSSGKLILFYNSQVNNPSGSWCPDTYGYENITDTALGSFSTYFDSPIGWTERNRKTHEIFVTTNITTYSNNMCNAPTAWAPFFSSFSDISGSVTATHSLAATSQNCGRHYLNLGNNKYLISHNNPGGSLNLYVVDQNFNTLQNLSFPSNDPTWYITYFGFDNQNNIYAYHFSGNTSYLFKYSQTAGLKVQPSASSRIKIFPNPSPGNLQIECEGIQNGEKLDVSITDLTGRTVYKEEKQNIAQINLTGLENGIYFLRVNVKNLNHSEKLIIQH